MKGRPLRLALYGDVDMNLVDGSSIWLRSLVEVLHMGSRNIITVVLKAPDRRAVVSSRLRELKRVTVVDPVAFRKVRPGALSPTEAVSALESLDAEHHFDVVVVRGPAVAEEACRKGRFDGRLWVYYMPPPNALHEAPDAELLQCLSKACRNILCQTEEVRCYVESHVPSAADKIVLLPPMVPAPESTKPRRSRSRGHNFRMVYAGKFSPAYCFLQMAALVRRLREEGLAVEFHVAGDKIHNPPEDPSYRPSIEAALRETDGLVWHGAMDRDQLEKLLKTMDLALSFRERSLDESLEISTKVLEYGALGLPVVLNRTPMYENLLGVDYPLFVSGPDSVYETVKAGLLNPTERCRAATACQAASTHFTFDRSYQRLEPYLRQVVPETSYVSRANGSPLRILIAGHDLKFFEALRRHFDSAGALVSVDLWKGHTVHDEAQSTRLLAQADVIVCEWCLGNAVWYSSKKRSDQRLIIRLHRVEAETQYPTQVEIRNVDRVVLVSPHIEREVQELFGWPREKLVVIANWVDVQALDRTKMPNSLFNLGILGFAPRRKRIDRALDILETLRCYDSRFHLFAKGKPPWEFAWVWRNQDERAFMRDVADRIDAAPLLRDAVSFESFGPVAAWMSKIGFLVSTSDSEGNQVSVAEAAASGAVPVVLERPGARDTYPSRWVHDTAEEAANWILELIQRGGFGEESLSAQEFARREFSPERICGAWDNLVIGA